MRRLGYNTFMPIFEYKCGKCGKRTQLLEKTGARAWFSFGRRCRYCGSRRLKRIYSAFATRRNESMPDLLNEMSRMGPVNFVPRPPVTGPPPGGCPFEKQAGEESANGT